MSSKPFQELGSASACVMRGIKEASKFETIHIEEEIKSDDESNSEQEVYV